MNMLAKRVLDITDECSLTSADHEERNPLQEGI
jgi:hypothetical protein